MQKLIPALTTEPTVIVDWLRHFIIHLVCIFEFLFPLDYKKKKKKKLFPLDYTTDPPIIRTEE
jgi:hypothetical protein